MTKADIPNVLIYNQPETTQNVAIAADARLLVKRDDVEATAGLVEHAVKTSTASHSSTKHPKHHKSSAKSADKKTASAKKPAHSKKTSSHESSSTHHAKPKKHDSSSSTTLHVSPTPAESTTSAHKKGPGHKASAAQKPSSASSDAISFSQPVMTTSALASPSYTPSNNVTIAPYTTGRNATSPQAEILAVAAAVKPKKKGSKKTKTAHKAKPSPKADAAYTGGKRGLSFNLANMTKPFGPSPKSDSQVTWAYNWYTSACGGGPHCAYNEKLDYIPMLFSDAASATSAWPAAANAAIKSGSSALFSFNEPDVCYSGSACMPVANTVAAYKKYMNPYAGKALLGAPAVTNGGAPYGLTYLQNFLKDCPTCHVDFINVHWYANKYAGAAYFEEFMTSVKEVAGGRPIWVSEYGLTDENPYTEAELVDFLKTTMSWMDQQPWIARYAYFMDTAGVLMGPGGKKKSAAGTAYDAFVDKTTQKYLG